MMIRADSFLRLRINFVFTRSLYKGRYMPSAMFGIWHILRKSQCDVEDKEKTNLKKMDTADYFYVYYTIF